MKTGSLSPECPQQTAPRPDESGRKRASLASACFLPSLVVGATFALLWFILINELRVEWTINPQYSYGWIVPLLCLGLLVRRWQFWTEHHVATLDPAPLGHPLTPGLRILCIISAFTILPLRWLLEAAPGWRTLNLLLALCIISLSLLALYRAAGSQWTRYLAFPVCLILIAVPWPYTIEAPVIQGLTQANARIVIEILGILGLPALQHGNTIEVSSGTVGIDEACSGIRSFQSSLMISLFLGEFFRLGLRRRLLLVPVGIGAAFAFNVCRTGLLAWVAARHGLAAVSQYHDRAGFSILLASTATLWLVAWLFQVRSQKAEKRAPQSEMPAAPHASKSNLSGRGNAPARTLLPQFSFRLWPYALGLGLWLLLAEAGVELWYRAHESRSTHHPQWKLNWPPQESRFREEPIAPASRELLAYTEGRSGSWESADRVQWRLYYFRWAPGRLALSTARGHNPNVCLAAAGKELQHLDNDRAPIQLGPLAFPFRRYEYTEDGRNIHVFHCLWEDHAPGAYFEFDPYASSLQSAIRAALQGRRNLGQRSLEFLISGIEEPQLAQAAVALQLRKLITVTPAP